MNAKKRSRRQLYTANGVFTLFGATLVLVTVAARPSDGSVFSFWRCRPECCGPCWGAPGAVVADIELTGDPGGTWYWLRSPEEEKRVVMGLYNRYCIRCHGVDGRGVWDIPNVPDFTNARWQACRSDAQLVRAILEGRGAVMPPFRGTLTLEESWGMARYLRTLVPGTEAPRPALDQTQKPAGAPNHPE
jgi:hypothetical protein